MTEVLPLFDYASLDTETRIVVQQKTGEIKDRIKRTAQDIVEVGERLSEVKGRLGHGRFERWLKAEFEWSDRTAQNLMNVADAFKTANFSVLSVAPSALYALSAPSVPETAREEAIDRAASGHRVTHADAKEIVEKHKPATPANGRPKPPRPPADMFVEEDRAAQAAVESAPPDAFTLDVAPPFDDTAAGYWRRVDKARNELRMLLNTALDPDNSELIDRRISARTREANIHSLAAIRDDADNLIVRLQGTTACAPR